MALSMPALAIPRPRELTQCSRPCPSLLRPRRNRDTSVTGRKGGPAQGKQAAH